jgi:RNA polymerase sigma factor (sigma-70 family)
MNPGVEGRAEFSKMTDDALVAEAAAGNMSAAAEYLSRHLRMLAAMSRRISGNVLDAEDLLSDAVMGLLRKWLDGTGPTEAVNAYVIRSMRNRVVDELRSPRSRETSIEWMELPADGGEIERVERESDLRIVRRALIELPEDQRRVLIESEVNGRTPRDLVGVLGRSAPAISSLLRRAKINLRTTVLQLQLDDQGPPTSEECERVLRTLPESARTPEEVERHYLQHGMDCPRCAKGVSVFVATLAGLFSSIVIAFVRLDATPAMATPGMTTRPRGARQAGKEPLTLGQRALVGAGSLALVSGVLVSTYALAEVTGTSLSSTALFAGVEVSGSLDTSGFITDETIGVAVNVAVEAESWQVDRLAITVNGAAAPVSTAPGWDCYWSEPLLLCKNERTEASGGAFTFTPDSLGTPLTYQVHVEGHTGATLFTGFSRGVVAR